MFRLPPKSQLLERVKPSRAHWRHASRPARIEPVGEGEESVWDFPRPPRLEPVASRLRVEVAGVVVAETTRGYRILETAGAPVYHFPSEDVAMEHLEPTGRITVCEWKGAATYFDVVVGKTRRSEAAYTYPDPFDDLGQGFAKIAGFIVFYASRVDGAFIDDIKVTPQPGGYYSGWVTPNLRGPIKGDPGSEGW
ncbi:MAG: DUF427 domain-containing protein [Pseudomonadota bacterium]